MEVKIIVPKFPNGIAIGEERENLAVPVVVDYTAWVEQHGAGALQILLQRPQDADPYPVTVTNDNGEAVWTPNETDMNFKGRGEIQLVYTAGGVIERSPVIMVISGRSLVAAGDPPNPFETWLEELTELAAETLVNAQSAEDSASEANADALRAAQSALDAEAAKTGAETAEQTAQQAAALARAKAEEAAEAAQIAGREADYAQQQNIAAGYSAESAHDDAERAAQSAEDAQAAASAAQTAASAAAASASAAAGSAAVAQELIEQIPDIEAEIDSKAPAIMQTVGPAAIASFADGADDMPLKSLVVDIPVTQSGTGDPSPENVRPFVGRTGATVAITDTAPNEAKAFVFEPTQEGSGTPSPTNVRPIEPGLAFERDDGTTLTVYGGTLTIDSDGTGKLVNRYYYLDGGALTWTRDASSWDFVTFRASTANYYANNARATVLSTQYPATTKNGAAAAGDNHVWMHYVSAANHWLVVRDDSKASMTASEFKTAMGGVYFAVQRANPVTYTLSATETARAFAALGINSHIIPITFPAETGTVYGGTLTINADGSGTLTKTHGYFDGGAKTWTKLTNYNYGTFWTTASGLKYEQKGNTVFSSNYKPTNNNAASASDDLYCWAKARSTTVNDVYVKDTANANMTASEFKEAMSGVQFVYVLANPVTYQLTAEQIRTLAGVNSIWSNAGDVTAVYPADTKSYIDSQTAALSGQIDTLGGEVDALQDDVDALEGDVADLSALPIISPPDVETLVEDGEYTDEAKKAIREVLGIPNFQSEVIYQGTVSEDSEIVTISTDSDGQPFELRAFRVLLELGASTTGNANFILARMIATNSNDVDFIQWLPTKKMTAATGSLIVYEFETYPGGLLWFLRAYAGTYNSTLGGIETMVQNVGIKSIKSFEFSRYNSTTTLIPAGSKITIIGIRA